MEIIVAILVGYILGSTSPEKLKTLIHDKVKSFHNYFKTPSSGRIELNWGVNKLLELFSEPMAQKWCESRVHLRQGVFKSLICASGFIYLVRIDLIDVNQEKGESRVFTFHGFQSLEEVLKKTEPMIVPFIEETNAGLEDQAKMHYYSTFVAGYNVVSTFMDARL